jgi:gas vesicle protein
MGKEVSSFVTGFFIGALVGGATALLLAPQSGEETRTQIREKSIELREKAEATYTEALKQLEATTEEIRKRTEEISAKVDQAVAQSREEIAKVAKRAQETVAREGADEGAAEA